METSTWSAVNLKKEHVTLSSKPKPTIWPHDTGQWIPCFDKCQLLLTITCMSAVLHNTVIIGHTHKQSMLLAISKRDLEVRVRAGSMFSISIDVVLLL